MKYDKLISESAANLVNGKSILFPFSTSIDILCTIQKEFEIQTIELEPEILYKSKTVLVSTVQMLKQYVKKIHPRIETFLVYNTRPLTLVFNNPHNLPPACLNKKGYVHMRIVHEDFHKTLVNKIGHPLLMYSFKRTEQSNELTCRHPTSLFNLADVVYQEELSKHTHISHRTATFNAEGELIFLDH